MPASGSDQSGQSYAKRVSVWRKHLQTGLPYVLTALFAVVLSLGIQLALELRQVSLQSLFIVPTPTFTFTPTLPTPTLVQTTTPTPTPPVPDERILGQEVLDLQVEVSRIWSAYYLMRAANQLADAEDALQMNDLDEVERLLVTVNASLNQAYDLSTEQDKAPIGEFRMRVGTLHENLRVRPEGSDQQFRRLRQEMLSLIEEDG